jgi:type IV secretory pathway component VirB8
MRREGDWVLVRLEDGSEGKVKADRFEEWLEQRGAKAPSVEEIAAFMLRARRRLKWQVMGLLGIMAAIALGMIIMMLIYS